MRDWGRFRGWLRGGVILSSKRMKEGCGESLEREREELKEREVD